ncbi:MAG TPA: L-threonylcarbamoyladenylate synthase [Nitrospirota bacterium]
MTEIIRIDSVHPDRAYARCRDVIRTGGVIAYPTDTFYGLGADPKNPAAVNKLYEIKGRRSDQPILLLIPDAGHVPNWAAEVIPAAEQLMKRFWPGPLTLVFRARADVLPELTAGTGSIGLRVPGDGVGRELLRFLDSALTGTSANRSGVPSPRTAHEAMAAVGGMVDLVLDGGETPGGNPSSVVDVRAENPVVIRTGAVDLRSNDRVR